MNYQKDIIKFGEVKNILKKEFDSEPKYNEKYLKAKVKPYNGKINTNFHNNKIPKEGCQCICLSVILLNSVFRTVKKYYRQAFQKNVNLLLKKEKDSCVYY